MWAGYLKIPSHLFSETMVCLVQSNWPEILNHMRATHSWPKNSFLLRGNTMQRSEFGLASSNEAGRIGHCFFWVAECNRQPIAFIVVKANCFQLINITRTKDGLKVNKIIVQSIHGPSPSASPLPDGPGRNIKSSLLICHVPSRPQILSPPSIAARDLPLRLPSYKVLSLYKSSLWIAGQGREPPRLSLTSPHTFAAGIITKTT